MAALSAHVANADGALSRLLAIEAWRISETDEARRAVEEAVQVRGAWEITTSSDSVTRLIGHTTRPMHMALSTTHAATVDAASVLRIWPLIESDCLVEISTHTGMGDLAWSHDESILASANGRVQLVDREGASLGFAGPRAPAALVGAWGENGFAYDVVTGDALDPLVSDGYLPLPATAAFLPDGSALAVSLGGLESPPSFGQMAREPELSGIPRPVAR